MLYFGRSSSERDAGGGVLRGFAFHLGFELLVVCQLHDALCHFLHVVVGLSTGFNVCNFKFLSHLFGFLVSDDSLVLHVAFVSNQVNGNAVVAILMDAGDPLLHRKEGRLVHE